MKNHNIYARACRAMENHQKEGNRAYQYFDLYSHLHPQEWKDQILSERPISEIVNTLKDYFGDEDSIVNMKKATIIGRGHEEPEFAKRLDVLVQKREDLMNMLKNESV